MKTESWLGVDYGSKRIGLAHADELRVAVPMEAASQNTLEERLAQIKEVIHRKKVRIIVLGYPLRGDGSVGQMAREVEAFRKLLLDRFQLPVELVDEHSTSSEAGQHWSLRKSRKRRQTGQLDSAAATLILRDYLDHQSDPVDTPHP